MKESTQKPSLKQRLLATLIHSTLAMITGHGMGISPLEAYAFLEQRDLFTLEQSYLTQFQTPSTGGQNDTFTG